MKLFDIAGAHRQTLALRPELISFPQIKDSPLSSFDLQDCLGVWGKMGWPALGRFSTLHSKFTAAGAMSSAPAVRTSHLKRAIVLASILALHLGCSTGASVPAAALGGLSPDHVHPCLLCIMFLCRNCFEL
jgi:hypothetical protein